MPTKTIAFFIEEALIGKGKVAIEVGKSLNFNALKTLKEGQTVIFLYLILWQG